MANRGPIIQTQWSLDNTVFQTLAAFRELSKAAAYDDVQTQAVYAFEALGSSLLVADHLVNDGLEALNAKSRYERLERIKLVLGLTSGGIAHLIKKRAPQCVPAFLLAVSLKTCLSDEEIGNVLYHMLIIQGLFRKPELRASRLQMGELVSAISGFGDSLVPQDILQSVGSALRNTIAASANTTRFFWKPESKVLAEIYSRLFESLTKSDVDRISLHGVTGAALIASSLIWLLSDSVEVSIDGVSALGASGSRVSIEVNTANTTNDSWTINEWRLSTTLSNAIIIPDEESNPSKSSLDFFPGCSAKAVLQSQYSLSNSQINMVGSIATAFIVLAVERGLVMTDLRYPGVQPRFVKLKNLCQSEYKSRIPIALQCFGWRAEEYSSDGLQIAKDIGGWIDSESLDIGHPKEGTANPLFQRPLQQIQAMFDIFKSQRSMQTGCVAMPIGVEIIEPAIHIAAESLYSATCSLFPRYRSFRPCHYAIVADNAMCILSAIFSKPLTKALQKCNPPVRISTLHPMHTLTVSQLRSRAMASLIPGAQIDQGHGGGIGESDLIFSGNGYVAVAEPLRRISTYPSDCVAIRVMAGYLRWDNEDASFEKLVSVEPRGDLGLISENSSLDLHRFDTQGQYLGLEPRGDKDALNVEYLVSVTGKQLSLTAYLCDPQTMNRTLVDFISSIEAVAFSTHISLPPLPSFLESSMAEEWKIKHIWATIRWTSANGRIDHELGTPVRYISVTYNNEPLRFFLAGRRNMQKLFMRHGSTALVNCIQAALQHEDLEETAGLIESDHRSPAPWVESEMVEQMLQPGWIIIT